MIRISLDPGGMHRAANEFLAHVDDHLRAGLEATLEQIAARAKQTTTFTDRTGALRASIQSDGVTGSLFSTMEGIVSFAARARPSPGRRRGRRRGGGGGEGFLYGLAQEYGTRTGIREKRFIRDAIDVEFGGMLEDALESAFAAAGFEVR